MSRWHQAFLGSLVGDALAMPVDGYYDRGALRRDYGIVDRYLSPKPQHPDSILGQSRYRPENGRGDILREQGIYWGQPGVHHDQFLSAGENTLDFRLAGEVHRIVRHFGYYDADAWLRHYIECMLTPGWHRDTYVEEYHRIFFTQFAQGKPPRECWSEDGGISGLAQLPALLGALPPMDTRARISIAAEHVRLTHRHPKVLDAAETLVRMLHAIAGGAHVREAIEREGAGWMSAYQAQAWTRLTDDTVVGEEVGPDRQIENAFPASLYIAWKYAEDFSAGVEANAMAGGAGCHRGGVVGALLGAANSVPKRWLTNLESLSYLAIPV